MTAPALEGKVAVITGGARGIGYATARTLKSLGMKVAVGDVDETRLLETDRELDLDAVGRLDVTDPESFQAFYHMVTDRLGVPHALVNNAGVMPVGPTVDEGQEVARRMVDINVHGVITGTKLALDSMLPRRSGHIINIASAGTQGPKGFRNAEPEQIAEAIADLLAHPRPRVYVTRPMGALLKAQRLMPAAWSEGLARRLGSDRMFLGGVDQQARSAYEERARKS